jgi:ABC-2 type transport system permease protein
MSPALTGSWAMTRLIVRRDRWVLPVGVLLLSGYPMLEVANASAGYVELARNPGFLMLYGPLYGSSIGAIATWSSGDVLWVYALVSILIVVRHTRAEEETGRSELLGSAVIGRHASLAAALFVAFAANVALALFTALGVAAQGLPAAGSVALGLRFAVVGLVFAAVAAVVAQLAQSASAARGISTVILGGTLLSRAAGDAGGGQGAASWLSWLSPLGWAHRIRPFASERWWILGLSVGVVGVLVTISVMLSARRDLGSGIMQPGLGPTAASPRLRSPLALAWRLHWGQLLGWTAGFAVIGGVFAGAAKSAANLFEGSAQLRDLFERLGGRAEAGDVFLAGIMSILGLIAGAYAVQATLRLRVEEQALRAEPVLATSVSRTQWAASHLAFSLVGPATAMAAAGLTAGLTYGISNHDLGHELPRVLAGAMVQLPAAWMLVGITLALYGLMPRLAQGGWVAWVVFLSIWTLGAFGQLSQRLLNLSPFTHIPKLPGAELTAAPLIWLGTVAATLVSAGLIGFRHRDIGPV